MNVSNICDYIIKQVIENGKETGIQYVVFYDEINKEFNVSLTEKDINDIKEELEMRDEIADIVVDDIGFDILIYIDYAENYDESNLIGYDENY